MEFSRLENIQSESFMSYSLTEMLSFDTGSRILVETVVYHHVSQPTLTNASDSRPRQQSHDSLLTIVENCLPSSLVTCLRINVHRGPLGHSFPKVKLNLTSNSKYMPVILAAEPVA